MGDKGKGSKAAPKKATKAGKHGLRPHEQRGQVDAAPAPRRPGSSHPATRVRRSVLMSQAVMSPDWDAARAAVHRRFG